MKNTYFVLLALLVPMALGGHIRLESSSYETIAYIREDGRIEDASFQPLGRIVVDDDTDFLRVEDDDFNVLGYIDENEFLDPDEEVIYELTDDGRLKNHRFRDVAIIRDDGTVESLNFSVMLYTDGSDDSLKEKIAIYIIYFSELLD